MKIRIAATFDLANEKEAELFKKIVDICYPKVNVAAVINPDNPAGYVEIPNDIVHEVVNKYEQRKEENKQTIENVLKNNPLSDIETAILEKLAKRWPYPISVNGIAVRIHASPATVLRTINDLIKRDLVIPDGFKRKKYSVSEETAKKYGYIPEDDEIQPEDEPEITVNNFRKPKDMSENPLCPTCESKSYKHVWRGPKDNKIRTYRCTKRGCHKVFTEAEANTKKPDVINETEYDPKKDESVQSAPLRMFDEAADSEVQEKLEEVLTEKKEEYDLLKCVMCESKSLRKRGFKNGKQLWTCKDCSHTFYITDKQQEIKRMIEMGIIKPVINEKGQPKSGITIIDKDNYKQPEEFDDEHLDKPDFDQNEWDTD